MITLHIPESQTEGFLSCYPHAKKGSLSPKGTRRIHFDQPQGIGDFIASNPIVKKVGKSKCGGCQEAIQRLNLVHPDAVDVNAEARMMVNRSPWLFRLPVVKWVSLVVCRKIVKRAIDKWRQARTIKSTGPKQANQIL
jgi:hypothetical protein